MRVTAAQLEAMRAGKPVPRDRRQRAARTEGDIVRVALEYLALRPEIVAWRQNAGGIAIPETEDRARAFVRLGVAGLPDICGRIIVRRQIEFRVGDVLHGLRVIAVPTPLYLEGKFPGRRRRPAQIAFIEKAVADGCLAGFFECIEDVVRIVERR